MELFSKKDTTGVQPSQRQVLENTIRNTRNNILLILAFSLINIILLVANSNTYFLFSAYVPYALADFGMLLTGKYPAEIYETLGVTEFFNDTFLAVTLAIAAVVLISYAICWAFSKNKPAGCLIIALVLFGIDTVLMLLLSGIRLEMLVDYIFHGLIIVSFARGISAVKKLKNLPAEDQKPETAALQQSDPEEEPVVFAEE